MTKKTDLPTIELVRKTFTYDPTTGVFRWAVPPLAKKKIGDVAGCPTSSGYIRLKLFGRQYLAHRVAWAHFHGRWPNDTIDHKDRNRANNRIDNLREATLSQQHGNMPVAKRNKLGRKGVWYWKKKNRFRAAIYKQGRCYHIGLFETAEEASAAYAEAAKKIFGEFACPDHVTRRGTPPPVPTLSNSNCRATILQSVSRSSTSSS